MGRTSGAPWRRSSLALWGVGGCCQFIPAAVGVEREVSPAEVGAVVAGDGAVEALGLRLAQGQWVGQVERAGRGLRAVLPRAIEGVIEVGRDHGFVLVVDVRVGERVVAGAHNARLDATLGTSKCDDPTRKESNWITLQYLYICVHFL